MNHQKVIAECDRYYQLSKFAGQLKVPEKMLKDITNYVLGVYAYTFAKVSFAELKFYKKYKEKLISDGNQKHLKNAESKIQALRSFMEVLKQDMSTYGKKDPILDTPEVLLAIENRDDIKDFKSLFSTYRIHFSKIFDIELDDLPANYPAAKMKTAYPHLMVNVDCSPGSKNRTGGYSSENNILINIGRCFQLGPTLTGYNEFKSEVILTVKHEFRHFIQKLMDIALGFFDPETGKELKPSNIHRDVSKASKALSEGYISEEVLDGETASIAKILAALGLDSKTKVDNNLINKIREDLKQSGENNPLKEKALNLLSGLFVETKDLEHDQAKSPKYLLRDVEYHTWLGDSKENFIKTMKDAGKKITMNNFKEFVGNPKTSNTNEFFSSLLIFDRSRWQNAVKELYKEIEPLLEME